MADKSGRHDANVQFAKLQRTKDVKATSDYEKTAAATRQKIERLKALRLARDAALPAEPPAPRAAAKKGSAGDLAASLEGEAKQGRNG